MDAPLSQTGRKRSLPEGEPPSPEGIAGSRKRAKVGEAAVAEEVDDRDEGEISDAKEEGTEGAEVTEDGEDAEDGEVAEHVGVGKGAVLSHNGWNGGVSSGLRTSFSSLKQATEIKPTKQADPEPMPTLESTLQPASGPQPESQYKSVSEVELQGEPKVEDEIATAVAVEAESEGLDEGEMEKLVWPDGYASYSKSRRARSWESRFEGWCIKLMSLNKDQERVQNAAFLRGAWTGWLKRRKHINPLSLTAGLQAAEKFEFSAERFSAMAASALSSKANSLAESPASTSDCGSSGDESNDDDTEQQDTMARLKRSTKKSESVGTGRLVAPPSPPADQVAALKPSDEKEWEDIFVNWCHALHQMNPMKVKAATTKDRNRLGDLYSQWVGNIDALSKKNASTARRMALGYIQNNSNKVAVLFSTDVQQHQQQQAKSNPNDQARKQEAQEDRGMDVADDTRIEGGNASTVPLTEGELAYRDRYYPGLAPDAIFCVNCSSTNHNSGDCSEITCSFCKNDHPAWRCPIRRRCTKCRQLGHDDKDCREKLRMSIDEMECAVCASRDHVETTCSKLWRNFQPNSAKPHKVKAVPVFCYRCGSEEHYGGDCGLNPPKKMNGNKNAEMENPWTMANARQYIDPSSTEVAIALSGESTQPNNSVNARPDLGKSIVPRRHIHFEADDDDDDEFIQPIVQKRQKTGDISFNGYKVNNSGRPAGGHGLPPKPPPPLPSGPPPPMGPSLSLPYMGYQAPDPNRYSNRNRNGSGRPRGGVGGGGGSNRGRGGFSNR